MLGDMDVPPFWPPFLTFWRLNSIFLGYFFSSTNTKTIFWGIKTTNSYRIRSFRPQISFFPRSFWVQVSAASGTPSSVFIYINKTIKSWTSRNIFKAGICHWSWYLSKHNTIKMISLFSTRWGCGGDGGWAQQWEGYVRIFACDRPEHQPSKICLHQLGKCVHQRLLWE